jgi:hypothetical protein
MGLDAASTSEQETDAAAHMRERPIRIGTGYGAAEAGTPQPIHDAN